MKIAIFSDVHGNLIALEQFIKSTRNIVDAYICLGDIVNYGPWNDECLELISSLPNITILEGNHERLFINDSEINNLPVLVQDFYRCSVQFFKRPDLIESLPDYINVGSFRCTHTLYNITIYEDTMVEINQNSIIGHSHHQFKTKRNNILYINPGSIGQNRSWINRIDYLVFDEVTQECTLLSERYDVDKFISELQSRKYPSHCIQYYVNKKRW